MKPHPAAPADAQAVRDLAATYEQMTEQIGRVIVGQQEIVEGVLVGGWDEATGRTTRAFLPWQKRTALLNNRA